MSVSDLNQNEQGEMKSRSANKESAENEKRNCMKIKEKKIKKKNGDTFINSYSRSFFYPCSQKESLKWIQAVEWKLTKKLRIIANKRIVSMTRFRAEGWRRIATMMISWNITIQTFFEKNACYFLLKNGVKSSRLLRKISQLKSEQSIWNFSLGSGKQSRLRKFVNF